MGFSSVHSNDVSLILNLRTGHISPTYHVVFGDRFSNVPSVASVSKPSSFWNTVDLEQNVFRIPLDNYCPACLDKYFLTPAELEEKSCSNIRQSQICKSFQLNPSS